MAKLALAKKVGIPVPTPIPSDVTHLVAYWGAPGFVPAYDQSARLALPIGTVPRQTVGTVSHFVFDTALIPAQAGNSLEIYFTLADATDAEEGDFSPVIAVPFDTVPPVRLAAPVVL